MHDASTVVDVAGYLPSDLSQRTDLWPAGPQRSGAHMTAYGLAALSVAKEAEHFELAIGQARDRREAFASMAAD